MSGAALREGQLVGGRYLVQAKLGAGGMGTVYRVHDQLLGETAALKVLHESVEGGASAARRFLEEIKTARLVSHRNVCRIHEYGEEGRLRFISMAYVDGADLKSMIRRQGRLPPAQALEVAASVADALQAIHDEGIVHRDLKPPNIMVDHRGIVRVMDFGIAKRTEAALGEGMTAAGLIMGTPEYMSPEQVLGQRVDARADIYALGIVLYEMLTGVSPFRGPTATASLISHLEQDPPLGPESGIPEAIAPILARALAREAPRRFASAQEMAAALRAAAAGEGATAAQTVILPYGGLERPTAPTAPPPPTAPAPTVTAPAATVPGPAAPAQASTRLEPRPARAAAKPAPPGSPPVAALAALGGMVAAAAAVVAFVLLRSPEPETPARTEVHTATPAPLPPTAPPQSRAPAVPATAAPAPATLRAGAAAPPARPAAPAPLPAATPAPLPTRPAAPDLSGPLAEAEAAYSRRDYAAAQAAYEQVLAADPANAAARIGLQASRTALEQARAALVPARSLVAAPTAYTRGRAQRDSPTGFRLEPGLEVERVDKPPPPPGRIAFEAEPAAVRAGEPYAVSVYFVNEGGATLAPVEAEVVTRINGREMKGPLSLPRHEVTPRSRMLLLAARDQWKTDTTSWSMTVRVKELNGDVYTGEIAWK